MVAVIKHNANRPVTPVELGRQLNPAFTQDPDLQTIIQAKPNYGLKVVYSAKGVQIDHMELKPTGRLPMTGTLHNASLPDGITILPHSESGEVSLRIVHLYRGNYLALRRNTSGRIADVEQVAEEPDSIEYFTKAILANANTKPLGLLSRLWTPPSLIETVALDVQKNIIPRKPKTVEGRIPSANEILQYAYGVERLVILNRFAAALRGETDLSLGQAASFAERFVQIRYEQNSLLGRNQKPKFRFKYAIKTPARELASKDQLMTMLTDAYMPLLVSKIDYDSRSSGFYAEKMPNAS